MDKYISFKEPKRLIKILAITEYGSKIEQIFDSYLEAKQYAKFLEQQNMITMIEPQPYSSFSELAKNYMDKIKDMDLEYKSITFN